MSTLHSIIVMLLMVTIGMAPMAIVMLLIGASGAPGAAVYALGQKTHSGMIRLAGLILATIGMSYTAGMYSVFIVGFLKWYAESRGDLPTWPFWIASAFHALGSIGFAMLDTVKDPSEKRQVAQHHCLGFVCWITVAIHSFVYFRPGFIEGIYGWVPFFESLSP